MIMYVCTMSSESREWVSLGKTKDEAREALLKAWNENQDKLKARGWDTYYYDTWEDLAEDYGINIHALVPGMGISY